METEKGIICEKNGLVYYRGEQKEFYKELERNRRWKASCFIICMIAILCIFIIGNVLIKKTVSQKYTLEEDNNFIEHIEKCEIKEDKIWVYGWCFYKNVDSINQEIQVFLKNIEDSEDVVWLDVTRIDREDIDTYYDCEFDYSKTGFEASAKLSKDYFDKAEYEIIIKLSYTEIFVQDIGTSETVVRRDNVKTVSTQQYISKGELTTFKNKTESEPLRTESTELNEVFDKGICLLYREEADLYVYQYREKLYWIAGDHFFFEEDNSTLIQYQLDTTRTECLPAERISNGWLWDNLDFVFEENEIVTDETCPYRVAVKNIPSEYPVLRFWTGYYHSGQPWTEYVNIDVNELVKMHYRYSLK